MQNGFHDNCLSHNECFLVFWNLEMNSTTPQTLPTALKPICWSIFSSIRRISCPKWISSIALLSVLGHVTHVVSVSKSQEGSKNTFSRMQSGLRIFPTPKTANLTRLFQIFNCTNSLFFIQTVPKCNRALSGFHCAITIVFSQWETKFEKDLHKNPRSLYAHKITEWWSVFDSIEQAFLHELRPKCNRAPLGFHYAITMIFSQWEMKSEKDLHKNSKSLYTHKITEW